MSTNIHHSGVIEEINGNTVFVRIIQQSACAGCHARSMCIASDNKEKIIEVTDFSKSFHPQESVMLVGKTSLGLQAVFLAFVIPLILVIIAIVLGTYLSWPETTSAIIAIAVLVPYYCLLYLMREKLKRRFIFTLEKITEDIS